MPLKYIKWHSDLTRLGIWKMEEPDEWYENQLLLSASETDELNSLSAKKRREWLASRWLLQYLIGTNHRVYTQRDEFGKPHLCNSGLFISLSHSSDLVAVIVSSVACGIDIQHFTPKIEIIADKFMSVADKNAMNEHNKRTLLTVFWGAKESLYKAYGKKELDFREDIRIQTFDFDPLEGCFGGQVTKGQFVADYRVYYLNTESYALSYCMKN